MTMFLDLFQQPFRQACTALASLLSTGVLVLLTALPFA